MERHEPESKKLRSGSGAGDGDGDGGAGGGGMWEGVSLEILALIFTRIPVDELLRTVPFVCKSWREAVSGSECWNEIDIEQWCRRCNRSDRIDSAVRKLVRRSRGTCTRLSCYKLSNAGLSFVANCVRFIKVLQIPMSNITDTMVAKQSSSFSTLKFLDISYCLKISSQGLVELGNSCKSLIHLRRNMPPPQWDNDLRTVPMKINDDEALAIADSMPELHHLELGYGQLSDIGLEAILTKCKKLTNLYIPGCWGVMLGGDLEEKCDRLEVFKCPWGDEVDDTESSDDRGDDEEHQDLD